MLIADHEEIKRSARSLVIRYGAHAAQIVREKADHTAAGREQDLAFLVLSEVERMMAGQKPPAY